MLGRIVLFCFYVVPDTRKNRPHNTSLIVSQTHHTHTHANTLPFTITLTAVHRFTLLVKHLATLGHKLQKITKKKNEQTAMISDSPLNYSGSGKNSSEHLHIHTHTHTNQTLWLVLSEHSTPADCGWGQNTLTITQGSKIQRALSLQDFLALQRGNTLPGPARSCCWGHLCAPLHCNQHMIGTYNVWERGRDSVMPAVMQYLTSQSAMTSTWTPRSLSKNSAPKVLRLSNQINLYGQV